LYKRRKKLVTMGQPATKLYVVSAADPDSDGQVTVEYRLYPTQGVYPVRRPTTEPADQQEVIAHALKNLQTCFPVRCSRVKRMVTGYMTSLVT